ncbi:hypothetical protein Lalb_Chr03g0036761 [Lupinus albus]|uniref:Uncharacterized protein n=1 Tax=Lupinus albus TaxID=3870 RepID=A0A6A4QU25_LUPAL|nr:hypothetical protein Lalb_Chr03g0036761 [Lupinus albus]
MKGLVPYTPLISRAKPPMLARVGKLPCCPYFSRATLLSACKKCSKTAKLRCREKSRLNFARGTIRAQASNVSFGPADDRSNNAKDSQNVFEGSSINDSSSKIAKPLNRIPYPISIALVLFGCALVFSLIAFLKEGP